MLNLLYNDYQHIYIDNSAWTKNFKPGSLDKWKLFIFHGFSDSCNITIEGIEGDFSIDKFRYFF
jgi:hypothetical protein